MSQRDDGGPAFPHTYSNGEYVTDGGMTLRDYFAGQALQGLVTLAPGAKHKSWKTTAEAAYIIADALLQARAG